MRVTLGTMGLGGRVDEAMGARLVDRALERGVMWLDTANLYGGGESERVLGRLLRGRRERVCLASKVGAGRVAGKSEGLSRARVIASVDESLARLGASHLELLFLHVPDPCTPHEETLGALGALLESGKILAWGVSNYASWEIVELFAAARAAGLPPPARAQQLYNLLVRQLDVEYFAFASRYGLATEVYNPLAGGLLTARHAGPGADRAGSRFARNPLYERRYWSGPLFARRDAYARLAASRGMDVTQLAYGFLASSPGVAGVLVGPTTLEQLDCALDALATPLGPELSREVDALHRELEGTDARYAR